jgi:hypothetical protein
MRQSVLISVLLHAAAVAIAYVDLPHLRRAPPMTEAPIVVEIINVAEETNAPAPAPDSKPEPEPEQKKVEPPPPPPPKTVAAPPPPPPPPPPPEPEPEVAAVPPPSPKPDPKPKPKPKAEPKPKAPPRLVKAKLWRKPKPPDAFTSVLRTVEELKRRPSQRPKEKADKAKKKEEEKKETFESQIAKALASPTRRFDSALPLSISEIDLVRQQIAACWNLPAGAREAEDLAIEVWVAMNPDGTVREARIRDKGRMETDPFFRSAAESALRAILNPRCNPLRLPRQKYDHWKTMTLTFDPREMFGS